MATHVLRWPVLGCLLIAAIGGGGGCASESRRGDARVTDVPDGASLAVETMGPLTYVAPRDGTAHLRDVAADRVVYRGTVRAGQRLVFDPRDGRATLDYQPIATEGLRRDSVYQLYFRGAGER